MSSSKLIQDLLNEISEDFAPPLSTAVNIESYADKIVKNATILSIIDCGKLAGFIAVYCNDPAKQVGYVTMLAVAKLHRSYGIGTQLIRMTVHYLKKRSFRKLSLEIYKSNPKAIAFYKRLGFTIEKETATSVFACKLLDD